MWITFLKETSCFFWGGKWDGFSPKPLEQATFLPQKVEKKREHRFFLFAFFCATLDVKIATLDALDVGHHLSCSSLW